MQSHEQHLIRHYAGINLSCQLEKCCPFGGSRHERKQPGSLSLQSFADDVMAEHVRVAWDSDPGSCSRSAFQQPFEFQSQQSFLDAMPQLRDRPLGATATFYVEVADAGLLCRQLQGQADFVSPLHRTFYGKEEFSVRDANGYILCFAGEPKDQMP